MDEMDRVVRTNNVHRTSQSPLVIRDWSVDRLQVQVTDQIFKWAGQPERKPFATQTQHSALLLRYQKHKIVQVPPGGLAQFKSNSIPEQKKSEYVQHPSWIPTKFEYSVAFPVNLLMLWVTCQHLAPSHSVDNDRDVRRISSFPEFFGLKNSLFFSLGGHSCNNGTKQMAPSPLMFIQEADAQQNKVSHRWEWPNSNQWIRFHTFQRFPINKNRTKGLKLKQHVRKCKFTFRGIFVDFFIWFYCHFFGILMKRREIQILIV